MSQRFAGRYTLVDHLGDGGAGSVWRAWDARRGQYVAAKLLRQRDAGALLRFVREQSLRVAHPHVVPPTGWAAEDDDVLLTMELVRGGSVATLLGDHHRLPPATVAVLLDQLLDALDAVHAAGVVHRDVKPANLLLEPTGTAPPFLRLADFGIAAHRDDARLTATGYVVGTWDIDASHSTVGFSVRHMMVSKVRGYFREFSGEPVTATDPSQSSVTATIDMDSIDTRQEQRDAHIKSADFFDVGNHTVMTFRSTGVRAAGEDWHVDGELTLKGITKPVTLELELNGFGPDAYGGTRAGFSAKTVISRSEFGVDIAMPMDGGGVVVGDKINVELEIEAVLRTA